MPITIYMGLPGSGKSRRLIERVNAALAKREPVSTFACSDSPWLRMQNSPTAQHIRTHRLLGSRQPGLTCPLDYFVSVDECATVLNRTPPPTLVAFDEAYHFGPGIVSHWLDASQGGLEVLIVSPSEPQLELLAGQEYSATTLPMTCERCSKREASTFAIVPGENITLSVCNYCNAELIDAARLEVLERLERQPPYPGEKALYQPIELEECASWRVLRPDSEVRADLMTRVLREVGLTGDHPAGYTSYLDLGCNTGFFCHRMGQLGFFAEGVDVVEDDIAVARILDSYFRRDNNSYVAANAYDYLRDTQDRHFDVTSAFSVFQWLMIQTSVDHGMACLEWLFQKTDRVCFLEMGYSSEPHYKDKIVGAHIDRSWVRNIMEEKGNFAEILMFDGQEYDLMFGARDLFVGLKASPVEAVGTPTSINSVVEDKAAQPATPRVNELGPGQAIGREETQPSSTTRLAQTEPGEQDEAWENVSSTLLEYASKQEYSEQLAHLLSQVLPRFVNSPAYSEYFRMWEEHNFHVTPVAYDQPLPDTRELTDDVWAKHSELVGIDMNEDVQLHLLKEVFLSYRSEYKDMPTSPTSEPYGFHLNNNLFDGTDALALYCMVRHFRPSRILEVGSGFSSRVSAQAALKNGYAELVCIEPYPDDILREGFPGLTTLVPKKVQEIGLGYFEELDAGDILFIDSSHVVKIGGDVNYLLLEVIPRLKPGVLVHFHDVFLPMEYRRDWVLDRSRFWTEQYLLQAFLSFNSDYEVLLCNAYLGYKYRAEMQDTFPNSPWWGGGSFWVRRKLS